MVVNNLDPADKIKVLHVIDTIDPASGGPVEAVRSLISFASHAIESEVISLDLPTEAYISGFPFKFSALGEYSLKRKIAPTYAYSKRLVEWLNVNARDFDCIIVHGIWCYNLVGVWLSCSKHEVPYIVYSHGMLDSWFKNRFPLKHIKKQIYWTSVLGRALAAADAVIFTAKDELEQSRDVFWGFNEYSKKIARLGIADGSVSVERELAAFKELAPSLNSKKFLLFLGRIDPKKGCDILIEAFSRVSNIDPDLQLVFAGPDGKGWQSDLVSMAMRLGISGRVHWLGMVRGDAKWGALRAADAFVLPSHQENFGIAVAEALSCSTPVVISNRINIWREIQAAGAGIVTDDNVDATITGLERFLRLTSEERDAMRLRARSAFSSQFDMREVIEDYIDICRRASKRYVSA